MPGGVKTFLQGETVMRIKFLALAIVAVIIAFIPSMAVCADAEVGDDAPAFVASTLNGKKFDLSALKGKVVVITFWATWCRACHFEMPALEAVWQSHHNEGMEVLAVSADTPDARKHVNSVMHFFTYPAAMLGEVSKNDLVTLTSLPVTYVIGKDGKVKDIITPPLSLSNEAEFSDKIKMLLKEKEETKPDVKADTKVDAKSETKVDKKE
jgi:peroxiredoxin